MWCHVLITKAGLGISGASIATMLTFSSNFIIIHLYVAFVVKDHAVKASWFFFDGQTFSGLIDYLKLGAPSAVMLCLEWWSFELLTLTSGYLGVLPNAA